MILLSFSHIDWELLDTYAIVAAGATTYPLSVQNSRVLVVPFLHDPGCECIIIRTSIPLSRQNRSVIEYYYREGVNSGGNC